MPSTIRGVVRDGRIVPESPLPEGTQVEIHIAEPPAEIPVDLAAEFDAWQRASDKALDIVEGPPSLEDVDATR